jgi:hypothetical protein
MMNTREIAEEYRLSYWSGIMRDRKESGLSIRAFCEAAGFHPNIYYYWQRKLREAASKQMLVSPEATAEKLNNTTEFLEVANASLLQQGFSASVIGSSCNPVPAGWAVCSTVDSKPKEPSLSIEIGKCRIAVSADTNEALLFKVCRGLVALC